jgi:hypothetical protein
MTDLRTLTDAFDELERRADAAAYRSVPTPRARSRRLVPVAAAAVVVAGLAAGAVWLVPGGDAPVGGTSTTTPSPSIAAFPETPDGLAARFREVVGDTATVVLSSTGALTLGDDGVSQGGVIVGTLTVSGVKGGFYVTSTRIDPDLPKCEACETLPDGARLSVDEIALAEPGGVTYKVAVRRVDGFRLTMYVSNELDAKGGSDVVAPRPPLTTDQMVTILTSDRWDG